jgi:H+/gluconate symporter-like permease
MEVQVAYKAYTTATLLEGAVAFAGVAILSLFF